MASPQAENGHVDIANEIMDALCRTMLSPYEWMVLMFIIRKTYGWKKKADAISLSQFSEGTGIKRQHVWRAISKLKKRNIVTQTGCATHTGYKKIATYEFQKDYDKWENVLPKQVAQPEQVTGVTHTGTKAQPVQGTTKDTQKTLIQKTNTDTGKTDAVEGVIFGKAYRDYPGHRGSFKVMFETFKSHKDWNECEDKLVGAIHREVEYKESLKKAGRLCPEWKHFKNWLIERLWEQRFPEPEEDDDPTWVGDEETVRKAMGMPPC